MFLNNIYLKTLRSFRVAIFGWGLGTGLMLYVVLLAVPSVITTAAAKADLITLAKSFAWLAEPIDVATPGGYTTFKYGFLILVMALWPLLTGSRILRGEEERGLMDALLSTPHSRTSAALQKIAAMWTALLSMAVLIGVIAFAGGQQANAGISLGNALMFGINLAIICGIFGGISLLVSQFTLDQRSASGITGGFLLVFIVLDMAHRINPNWELVSRFSPIYYYNLSKALIPSYGVNYGAIVVQLILCVLLYTAAVALFIRRDIGQTTPLPMWLRRPQKQQTIEQALPAQNWSLQSVFARSIANTIRPGLWWTLGIAGFFAWMVVVVKQTENSLNALYAGSPTLVTLLQKVGGSNPAVSTALLSTFFVFLPILLMTFTVTQASAWAADEENGRQELLLATPKTRLTIFFARFGALTVALIFISLVTLAGIAITAQITGLQLNSGNLTAATLSVIPQGLFIGALGYLFSGWLKTSIDTGLLSFLLLLWFFITFVGPELNWPDATLHFSALYYYGTPLANGLPVGSLLEILAASLVCFAAAAYRYTRKDIAR